MRKTGKFVRAYNNVRVMLHLVCIHNKATTCNQNLYRSSGDQSSNGQTSDLLIIRPVHALCSKSA
jgi:hypothetical protein